MCGRFSRASGREALADEFPGVQLGEMEFRPRYNVAPSQTVEAIICDAPTLRLAPMRWGFTPAFAKDPTFAPINARAETVATSPLFRQAFRRGRCLIVADGFYEWRKDGRRKTPYFVHLRSGRPFGFAGIYAEPASLAEDGTMLPTCAIITCSPNKLLAEIHNRMPVILSVAARARWLDPSAASAELLGLLTPLPAVEMDAYEVSTWVNSPRNDTPECIRAVSA
jgi:putative SOS response-associated peptidase YedK